jgi:hypothetical protein
VHEGPGRSRPGEGEIPCTRRSGLLCVLLNQRAQPHEPERHLERKRDLLPRRPGGRGRATAGCAMEPKRRESREGAPHYCEPPRRARA